MADHDVRVKALRLQAAADLVHQLAPDHRLFEIEKIVMEVRRRRAKRRVETGFDADLAILVGLRDENDAIARLIGQMLRQMLELAGVVLMDEQDVHRCKSEGLRAGSWSRRPASISASAPVAAWSAVASEATAHRFQ